MDATPTLLFYISLEVPTSTMRQGSETKSSHSGQEGVKLRALADDMIIFVENLMEPTTKLLSFTRA